MKNGGKEQNFYYKEIKRRVLAGIKRGEYLPGDKIPTIREFADDLGCSPHPARMAIRELASERKLEIRHGSGVFVRKERQGHKDHRLIALISASLVDDTGKFGSRVLSAIQKYYAERNIALTLMIKGSSIDAESHWLDFCLDRGFEGIMLQTTGMSLRNPRIAEVAKEIPMVVFDNCLESVHCDCVTNDNYNGIRKAMDFLLALGHSEIAFYGPFASKNIKFRKAGYIDTLEEHGFEINNSLIAEPDSSSNSVMDFFAGGKPVTAIVCYNDYCAKKAYEELTQLGLKIPDDVSVFGFGDLDFGQYLTPQLSTVDQFPEQLGDAAAEALLLRIENANAPPRVIKIPTRLIHRDSVKKASR